MESSGQRLKRIRLEKGLSLEEAHKKTKLQMNILQAIEGDSLSDVNPAYLKGFIKIYCNFLGQDPKDFSCEPLKVVRVDAPSRPVCRRPLVINKDLIRYAVYALIFIVAVFALLKLGRFIFSRKPHTVKRSSISRSVAVKQPVKKAVVTSKPQPQATAPKIQQEAVVGLNLTVSAKESCLLNVKVDGKTVFHRKLEKSRSETWRGLDKIEMFVANAAAVELHFNTQHFSTLGKRGQKLNIVITKKEGLKFL